MSGFEDKPPYYPPPPWWLKRHPEYASGGKVKVLPTPDRPPWLQYVQDDRVTVHVANPLYYPPPKPPVPSNGKPKGRKGPLAAVVLSAYISGAAVVNTITDTGEDQIASLKVLPIALICLIVAVWWLDRRAAALERWKQDREFEWWLKDLPEEQ